MRGTASACWRSLAAAGAQLSRSIDAAQMAGFAGNVLELAASDAAQRCW